MDGGHDVAHRPCKSRPALFDVLPGSLGEDDTATVWVAGGGKHLVIVASVYSLDNWLFRTCP